MWCSLSSTLNTKSEPGPAELPAPEEPQREQMPMLSGGARWATVWPNPLNWRTRERAQSRTCNLGQATLPFIRRVLCLRRLCTALCQQPSRMKDGPHLHQHQVQDTQPRRRGRPLRSAAIPQCGDLGTWRRWPQQKSWRIQRWSPWPLGFRSPLRRGGGQLERSASLRLLTVCRPQGRRKKKSQ